MPGRTSVRRAPASSPVPERRLLDLGDWGVFTASLTGRLTYVNAALADMLACGPDAPASCRMPWVTLRHIVGAAPWPLLSSSIGLVALDVWLHRRDGSRIAARLRARSTRDTRLNITGFEGIVTTPPDPERAARRLERLRARLASFATRRSARAIQERRALARRIHDDMGQAMFVLRMEVEHLADLLTDGRTDPRVLRSIETVRASTDDALRQIRALCVELRETGDGLLDLSLLIDPVVAALARRGRLTGRVLTTGGRVQIEGRRAILVSEICREAVTNVIRHARATTVIVRIMRRGTHFSVSIRDDGQGFTPEAIASRDAFGVIGMRERAQALGGSLTITREDGHTVVSVAAPLRSPERMSGGQNA